MRNMRKHKVIGKVPKAVGNVGALKGCVTAVDNGHINCKRFRIVRSTRNRLARRKEKCMSSFHRRYGHT
jgi:hypothetical protein